MAGGWRFRRAWRVWLIWAFLMSLPLAAQPPAEGVSRELARARAGQISEVRYRLSLHLAPDAEQLPGHAVISFTLRDTKQPVVLDFRDGTIEHPLVNAAPAEAEIMNGHIVIPARYFTAGHNTITLDFTSEIATAGRAITRFVDRDDGSPYIYSLFVPMDASQAFPCFDQPDLKARFKLDIAVPENWTVVSNTNVESAKASGAGYRNDQFTETQPLPTYLFAFAAGPFRAIQGDGVRLFVRRSKFARASEEAPEVMRIAHAGVEFLSGYFARAFPFPKYDLVLIPGFPFGGMEHAGATFLREESVLFRSVPTESDKIQRAALVLHETSHQWFGDLVTMRWFDDLWLKEGFAQYMAYEALAAMYPSEDIWKRFYQSFKPPAYAIDATEGTTPIHQAIENLKDAKSAYGAIVYSKTPGILRQLSFVIGETAFRDGVRLFLREHAYGNADWDDLVHAYERASGKSLAAWADAWIKQRGMPQVDVVWSCRDGAVDQFSLHQTDVLHDGYRWPIRTQILAAYEGAPAITVPAESDGARTDVPELLGKACPAFVFGNDQDYAYGRFLLDARSQQYLTAHIDSLGEPFRRALIWGAFWDGVRELRMAPSEYLRLAVRAMPFETDEAITQSVLGHVATAFTHYLSAAQQAAIAPELEAMLEHRMQGASDLSLRILYYRAFRSVAMTRCARAELKRILAGQSGVPGLEIKPLDRWTMIAALLAQSDPDASALLDAEEKRDTSGDGRKYAYATKAARPDGATKRQYFDDYLKNPARQEDWIEQSLPLFNYWNQSALTQLYLERALDSLPQIKRDRKIFFLLAWLNAFIGGQDSSAAAQEVRQWLHTHPIDADLQRKILEVLDEMERTVRIRARFG